MTEADVAHRVFFALWPGGEALEALEAAARRAAACCGGRRMRGDSLHLTLEFVGRVDATRLQQLYALAGAIEAADFDLEFDRGGYWRHNRIYWAGCSVVPTGLRALSGALRLALAGAGFSVEGRAFVPHVTLLRDARCADVPGLPQPIRWPAREFALVESLLQADGARYQMLARWPLPKSA